MPAGMGVHYWDADVFLSPRAAEFRTPQALTHPYDGNPLELTVFVSCYNEKDYITTTLGAVEAALQESGFTHEIIVIDDCSSDNSVELIRQFMAVHPHAPITLRVNKKNKGWAQNYIDGAFMGCGKYYRPICGDNSESKETMLALFGAIGQADIIVPYYRSVENRKRDRVLLSKAFTAVVNVLSGHRLRYYNGLATHLRHNVMRWHPYTRGFGFQADILCKMLDLGFTYKQIEAHTAENRKGRSNALTGPNILSVLHTLVDIFLRRISNRIYKQKA